VGNLVAVLLHISFIIGVPKIIKLAFCIARVRGGQPRKRERRQYWRNCLENQQVNCR